MSKAKIVAGTVFGAVAGFVAGILTAPKSGKETQADLKEAGLKAKDRAVVEADKLKKTVAADTEKAKAVVGKTVKEAKDTAEDVIEDVTERADDLRKRSVQAFEGAKQGFAKNPDGSAKKSK